MSPYIDRPREWSYLDRVLADVRRRGQLFLISGRRGAGKTALVKSWLSARRKRALYWTASEHLDERDQAADFAQALHRHLGVAPKPAGGDAGQIWTEAFAQLAEVTRTHRQIVIIDQLTDMLREHGAFASALQQAWDWSLQDQSVLLILIGEPGRHLFEHLRSYDRAPLYGRFTAIWPATPIPWSEYSIAFRQWALRDRLLAYSITGGWPAFVGGLDPKASPRAALTRLVRAPDFVQSALAVVGRVGPTRLPVVLAMLRALAMGPASQATLARRSRLSRRIVNAALVDLEIADLVNTRDMPVRAPVPWTQRVFYRLVDEQVSFVFSAATSLSNTAHEALAAQALAQALAPAQRIPADGVMENLLIPWLFRAGLRNRLPEIVDDVGPLTVDLPCDSAVAALNRSHPRVIVCGVFSQRRRVGEARVRAFARAARRLIQTAWPEWPGRALVVSLSGYTEKARLSRSEDDLVLMDAESLARDLAKWRQPSLIAKPKRFKIPL